MTNLFASVEFWQWSAIVGLLACNWVLYKLNKAYLRGLSRAIRTTNERIDRVENMLEVMKKKDDPR